MIVVESALRWAVAEQNTVHLSKPLPFHPIHLFTFSLCLPSISFHAFSTPPLNYIAHP